VTPESLHDLFVASASTAGALIGLLFVAVSIAHERLTAKADGLIHRIRASAALTAFTNALTVSLFALIPDGSLGTSSVVVGLLGLAFISGSVISVARHMHLSRFRDLTFLLFLTSVCVQQVIAGLLFAHNNHKGDADWLAILVIVCFLIGIQRAWELIGGPDIGLSHEVFQMVRHRDDPNEATGSDIAAGPPAVTDAVGPLPGAVPDGSAADQAGQ
jgi:hypothetical protein